MTEFPIIIKADGTKEQFDPVRLITSMKRSGAGANSAERIARLITNTVVPGTTSREIYSKAFNQLRKEARHIAARYALRRALMELGPSGHPFEDFISHLFRAEGWNVETRKMIMGKCVIHEVDLYASRRSDNAYLAAELKYHNDPSCKTDLKVALYVKSRFDDIFSCDSAIQSCPIGCGMLITNTKFTSEVVKYSECTGLKLLGWGYPEDNSLFHRMSAASVYPITILTSLTRSEKRLLISKQAIAVHQIVEDRSLLDSLKMTSERVGEVLAEVDSILTIPSRVG